MPEVAVHQSQIFSPNPNKGYYDSISKNVDKIEKAVLLAKEHRILNAAHFVDGYEHYVEKLKALKESGIDPTVALEHRAITDRLNALAIPILQLQKMSQQSKPEQKSNSSEWSLPKITKTQVAVGGALLAIGPSLMKKTAKAVVRIVPVAFHSLQQYIRGFDRSLDFFGARLNNVRAFFNTMKDEPIPQEDNLAMSAQYWINRQMCMRTVKMYGSFTEWAVLKQLSESACDWFATWQTADPDLYSTELNWAGKQLNAGVEWIRNDWSHTSLLEEKAVNAVGAVTVGTLAYIGLPNWNLAVRTVGVTATALLGLIGTHLIQNRIGV